MDPKKLTALDEYFIQNIKSHTHQTLADKGTYTNTTNTRNRKNIAILSIQVEKESIPLHLEIYSIWIDQIISNEHQLVNVTKKKT